MTTLVAFADKNCNCNNLPHLSGHQDCGAITIEKRRRVDFSVWAAYTFVKLIIWDASLRFNRYHHIRSTGRVSSAQCFSLTETLRRATFWGGVGVTRMNSIHSPSQG